MQVLITLVPGKQNVSTFMFMCAQQFSKIHFTITGASKCLVIKNIQEHLMVCVKGSTAYL